MDDELLSKRRKTSTRKFDSPSWDWVFAIAIPLAALAVFWVFGIQWIDAAIGYVLLACWIAGVCYARFLGIGHMFRFFNRIAERFVNPPGPDPDDKSESN